MAKGDVHIFGSYLLKAQSGGGFNLGTDSLKMGIVSNATVPTVSTADPRWGAGGSTDLSAGQVSTGGTGYTGPVSLAGVTLTRSNGVVTLAASNVAIPQDAAAGFANGYYGILYDSTVAGNFAVGYVDLGGPVGNTGGPININWNVAGIATWTAS